MLSTLQKKNIFIFEKCVSFFKKILGVVERIFDEVENLDLATQRHKVTLCLELP